MASPYTKRVSAKNLGQSTGVVLWNTRRYEKGNKLIPLTLTIPNRFGR